MAVRTHRFSIARFSVLVVLQLAVLAVGFKFAFPKLWVVQVEAGLLAFAVTFLVVHLGVALFEWFFHRYVLHAVTAPWLTRFARGHRNHHGLTAIKLKPAPEGADRYVLNEYPITAEEQYPDSDFPVYALIAFWVLFTPVLLGAQFLAPQLPVMLAGYAAIAWSMALYEILHSIEHWPYEWWQKATEHPRFGALWRRLYGFHQMHHANIGCNEAISGFFGLPIPDWLFGTYHQPKELLLSGRMATAKDFAIGRPLPFVQWLDRWAQRRESAILRRQKQ